MNAFDYPAEPHTRRHGPLGYKDYQSYRDWLRDEFTFRCVYCLHREQWYQRGGVFHIEHFEPVASSPERNAEYKNLLYSCATCNQAKGDALGLPDPCEVAFSDCLRVLSDGQIEPLSRAGYLLVQVLRLNNADNVRHRSRWLRVLQVLQASDADLFQELMGFPEDLPDLRRKRVPANSKPDGAENCYFALREKGELPSTY